MIRSIKIIVPTLNSYLILPKLVDSLKNQTWKAWQVLFVDGNSNSRHKEWLRDVCLHDPRFDFIKESKNDGGIFGAMNQGLVGLKEDEWVLFWGSDDWAFSPHALEDVIKEVNTLSCNYDLIVCRGQYIDAQSNKLIRKSYFIKNKKLETLDRKKYRNKLFLGLIPPHQTTLFNKKIFQEFSCFTQELKLAADLDYFLRASHINNLSLLVLDKNIVNMSTNGISSKQNILRFKEVIYSYKKSFGYLFLVPFLLRYIRRIILIIIK